MLNPRLVRLSDRGIDRSLRRQPIRPPPALTPDEFAVALGYVIYRVRWRAGLSQRELAVRLHINRSAVSRWESGVRFPTVSHLALLGELTGRPASSILLEAEDLLRLARHAGAIHDGLDPNGRDEEVGHAADD